MLIALYLGMENFEKTYKEIYLGRKFVSKIQWLFPLDTSVAVRCL